MLTTPPTYPCSIMRFTDHLNRWKALKLEMEREMDSEVAKHLHESISIDITLQDSYEEAGGDPDFDSDFNMSNVLWCHDVDVDNVDADGVDFLHNQPGTKNDQCRK
ncbi:uncharacterized protein LOC128215977 [Mya arenaria]|uniref:uncharacterized protein LOC128215977 n=1 Tax=Mya arenaria TaxID=6604 RepID=UPI0022E09437|nr:uncharacterized protein LOC128215977 [Mya arenaria]